jgi:hypothetical protein
MAPLEDIISGSSIRGLWPDGLVTVLEVKWLGTVAIEVAFEGADGHLGDNNGLVMQPAWSREPA